MTPDPLESDGEDAGPADDAWTSTMGDVSHTPDVGDRIPEIWHRGGD